MSDPVNSSDEAVKAAIERVAQSLMEARYPPGTVEDGCLAPVWAEWVADPDPARQDFVEAWRAKARPDPSILAAVRAEAFDKGTLNSEAVGALRQKIRVLRRPNGLWHWWCPCCMGGDFGWSFGRVLGQALAHAQLPHDETSVDPTDEWAIPFGPQQYPDPF